MNIFTSWIFWLILAFIVFVFAMIGFLAENGKKKKEEAVSDNQGKKSDEKEAINSGLTDPVEPGATLNLDNGTWKNESNVQNVSLSSESFSVPSSVVTETVSVPEPSGVSESAGESLESKETISVGGGDDEAAQSVVSIDESDESQITEAADLFKDNDDDDVWKV